MVQYRLPSNHRGLLVLALLFQFITPTYTLASKGAPSWVKQGSGLRSSAKGKVFYGVGSAGGIRNPALLRTTADNRARSELTKIFQVFSASLMKDYMASDGQQNVEQAIKTFFIQSLMKII